MSFPDSCPLIKASLLGQHRVMLKSHRIALRPTPKQEALFGQHAGYARFAYN